VTETKASLLIVEDDPDVADMLDAYFRVQGYRVFTAYLGEEAVTSCRLNRPDLLILDIRLPDIDGYEVARRLRSNRRTDDIPIIFLTEKRARADRLQGLELGADDYITKPFDIQELRLRVRNTLRRAQHNALVNPVTNLPEGALVDERLDECLGSRTWALLGITLENLDAFRETYGFVASDDVLRAISLMIHNAVREIGNPSDFIGQVSPNEFLLVTTPGALPALTERIRSRLDQAVDYFYPLKDRGEGALQGEGALRKDRLHVTLGQVQGCQKDFSDTNELKSELFAYGR
jgi:DNA-binding response OmpR family regulator